MPLSLYSRNTHPDDIHQTNFNRNDTYPVEKKIPPSLFNSHNLCPALDDIISVKFSL